MAQEAQPGATRCFSVRTMVSIRCSFSSGTSGCASRRRPAFSTSSVSSVFGSLVVARARPTSAPRSSSLTRSADVTGALKSSVMSFPFWMQTARKRPQKFCCEYNRFEADLQGKSDRRERIHAFRKPTGNTTPERASLFPAMCSVADCGSDGICTKGRLHRSRTSVPCRFK